MATSTVAAQIAPRQDNIVRLPVRPSRVRLTDRNVVTLPGGKAGERCHYDTIVPGLGLRIADGRRTFVVVGRTTAGRSLKLKLGMVGAITVADARRAARVVLGALARGEDPGADRKAARKALRASRTGTDVSGGTSLRQAVDTFLRARERDLRDSTWRGYQRAFRNHALPALGDRDVRTITGEDLDALHARVTARSGPAAANRLRSALSALFSHAVRAKLIERNPVAGSARHREQDRERVLERREMAALIRAARERGDVAGHLIEFLVLTACRKGEALAARWRDFDLDAATWCKPASTTKGRRDHVVPLSPEAVALLRSLPSGAERVFAVGASTLHRAFRACLAAAGITGDTRVHDLRRSAATALAMAGAPMPVVGRLLGHRPGSAITARIYARSTSAAEVEAAAQLGRLLA